MVRYIHSELLKLKRSMISVAILLIGVAVLVSQILFNLAGSILTTAQQISSQFAILFILMIILSVVLAYQGYYDEWRAGQFQRVLNSRHPGRLWLSKLFTLALIQSAMMVGVFTIGNLMADQSHNLWLTGIAITIQAIVSLPIHFFLQMQFKDIGNFFVGIMEILLIIFATNIEVPHWLYFPAIYGYQIAQATHGPSIEDWLGIAGVIGLFVLLTLVKITRPLKR